MNALMCDSPKVGYLLIALLVLSLQSAVIRGFHIELTDQQEHANEEGNNKPAEAPISEPCIISSTPPTSSRLPSAHQAYDAMIDHLKQLERAPEAVASVIVRLREALKRLIDRIPTKGPSSLDVLQNGDHVGGKSVVIDDASRQNDINSSEVRGEDGRL